MNRLALTSLILPIAKLNSVAQDLSPRNSYFVVSAGEFADNVWFGHDTAGDIGFQSGLDILGTIGFTKPVKIDSYDSLAQITRGTGTCGNLIKNIKSFKENTVKSTIDINNCTEGIYILNLDDEKDNRA